MSCTIVIPAYEPGQELVPYVDALLTQELGPVLIIDDGSGGAFAPIFTALEGKPGCTVLHHTENRGKGAALKTAFAHYLAHTPEGCAGIITVDCDGQHAVPDVLRLQQALEEHPDALVLGVRDFGPDTPARSRRGNRAASMALSALYGIKLGDTQTGLRGVPNSLLPALAGLRGDRFEYELNMLITARQKCVPFLQVPIQTIYFNNNSGSHFRTFADLFRILALLGRSVVQYAGAAALSVVIDVAVYAVMVKLLLLAVPLAERIFLSTVTARILSSVANYLCNRRLPYVQNKKLLPTMLKYYVLWFFQLMSSFFLTWLLSQFVLLDDLAAKLLVDIFLAVISYQIQLRWVFRAGKGEAS